MENEEEERNLENQLESQLREQKESVDAIKEALVSDPTNSELLSIHEELVGAIRDGEEGLFQLKRARLLREADVALYACTSNVEDAKVELLDPMTEPEALEEEGLSVGSKCRFRHTDGRWYNGQIVGLEGSSSAKICFLTPTSENMLMCKFFQQQRCRFGTSCRLSHGIDIPLSSIRKYVPTIWDQSLVGSSIWAVADRTDIWRKAELESWDDNLKEGQIVFRDDGSSSKVGTEAMSLSEYAEPSSEEESDSNLEEAESSDYEEEDSPQGIGFLESTNLLRGIQKETAVFAKWENHTRGIASKMMANMGYREGMGLGATGQGVVNPVAVKVLPPKQSLDHAFKSHEEKDGNENRGKKRSRGGQRKRDKKFAAAARAAKERKESSPDVFSLINAQLAKHAEAQNGSSTTKGTVEKKQEDRRAILAHEDEVKELRTRVKRLEEMVNRNRKEKAVFDAATKKLNETKKALADAMAAHASATNAVASKDKEKRWLKF